MRFAILFITYLCKLHKYVISGNFFNKLLIKKQPVHSESQQLDVEARLREYLPSFFSILGTTPFGWAKINETLRSTYENRMKEQEGLKADKGLEVEASFFDIISAKLNGNVDAARLLEYFDKVLQELDMNLPLKKKPILATTLKGLLVNPDKNYLNYMGELSVLNNCLKSNFTLIKMEERLPNGKGADLHLQHNMSKRAYFVEVVNIHYNYRKTYTDQMLVKEIRRKLMNKWQDETKGITDNLPIYLAPVLWASYDELQQINALYSEHIDLKNDRILAPMAFCSYTDSSGRSIYKFGQLPHLLNLTS